MSISFVTGKPGGGKGLYSMKLIIDELVNGKRPILTNLAVKVGPWVSPSGTPQIGLRAYLQKRYGQDFDCERRIMFLTDEQCPEFYRYRQNRAGELIEAHREKNGKGICISYDTSPAIENGGVVYVIDEGWKFFGARQWQDTGPAALFYAAQHRKLGDDFILVTQNSKQIDTAFRQLAQDFMVISNHAKVKVGIFRQPGVFSVATFTEPPTGANEPVSKTYFKLDASGIGGCYDTSAGVGLAGAAVADVGERKRGVHWAFALGAFILFLVALWYVPVLLGKGLTSGANLGTTKSTNSSPAIVTNLPASTSKGPVVPARVIADPVAPKTTPVPGGPVSPLIEEEKLTGLVRVGGLVYVSTTEGFYRPGDRDLEFIGNDFVIIRGRVFRWPRKELPQDTQRTGAGGALVSQKARF